MTLRNNTSRATVEVLESRRQILIVAEAPHPDVAALRQAMETNAHQETAVLWADELASGVGLLTTMFSCCIRLIRHPFHKTCSTLLPQTERSGSLGGASTVWNNWPVNVVGFQHEAEPLVTEAQGRKANAFEPFPLPADLDRMTALWPPWLAQQENTNPHPRWCPHSYNAWVL